MGQREEGRARLEGRELGARKQVATVKDRGKEIDRNRFTLEL